jgi:hypothetical protein
MDEASLKHSVQFAENAGSPAGAPALRCSICKQPILPGETFDPLEEEPYHDDARDCIAAVVRRCVEIARTTPATNPIGYSDRLDIIAATKTEFPEVFHV